MNKTLKLFSRRKIRTSNNIRKNNKSNRVRLSVFRSNLHIYAQLIDDSVGKTLISVSTLSKELKSKIKNGSNTEAAREVGLLLAKKAEQQGVKQVVFDKGGYKYHGRVKALAEAARESEYLDF